MRNLLVWGGPWLPSALRALCLVCSTILAALSFLHCCQSTRRDGTFSGVVPRGMIAPRAQASSMAWAAPWPMSVQARGSQLRHITGSKTRC